MARKETVPPDEREIGVRLRQFRESRLIARTAFALSVGIGYQRLESYEAGRVPLPYGIYKAVNAKYFVSAQWLVTGLGNSTWPQPFDERTLKEKPDDRELLSAVYYRVLVDVEVDLTLDVIESVYGPNGLLDAARKFMLCLTDPVEGRKVPKLTAELVRGQMQEWIKILDETLATDDELERVDPGKNHSVRHPSRP